MMKKIKLLSMVLAGLAMFSCSDDDDNVVQPLPEVEAPIEVVLSEVQYQTVDLVEIQNTGSEAADLSDFWLCLGPNTYERIGDITPQSGSITNLQPGAYLVLPYSMPDDNAGLGLYSENDFGNSDAIVDFVQYGSSGSAREDVAVEAGIWNAGEFVPTVIEANNSIVFDGNGNGAANWAETISPTFGAANELMMPVRSVAINEVQYGNQDVVELINNGNVSIDLESFYLCLGSGTYERIGTITPISGTVQLAPGELLTLPYTMPDDQGGLGLYSINQFTNPDAIVDFVQYGAPGSQRENIADQAGIWNIGDFVPVVRLNSYSIEFDGEGNSSSDWAEEVNPSLGQPNDFVAPTTTFDITISNVINYLNVHTFAERTSISNGNSEGPGPLNNADFQYQVQFQAVPGTRFTPVTMMGNSNDWFLAPRNSEGIDLFPNGSAITGDIAGELILFDAGTEDDNLPEFFPPAGANVGPVDPNPLTRTVDRQGRDGATYITAVLDYAPGNGSEAGVFTLTIRPVANMLPNPDLAPSSNNGFVATPGIVVLHTQPDPVFTLGQEDRGFGLEALAEDGNPFPLFNWFTETGSGGAPLRLASSLTVFSPGLVYAFSTDSDPFFTQGQPSNGVNGLEQLSEDGNNAVAVEYLSGLGLPVAASQETSNVGPGESLNFTIEVPQGLDYKFGFGTMFVDTNDWFMSYNNVGFPLFDESGAPVSGTEASIRAYLYDAGYEEDQPVGFGPDQAPRQAGPNTGAADGNNIIRRVSALEDVQFGKGLIQSGPGVVYIEDSRGGYNVIRIDIQPR